MAMTLENTIDNVQSLEDKGYKQSPVSKPNGMSKVLRYDVKRMVYWFTGTRHYLHQDTDIHYTPQVLIYCG
jgi:hypothetical protein